MLQMHAQVIHNAIRQHMKHTAVPGVRCGLPEHQHACQLEPISADWPPAPPPRPALQCHSLSIPYSIGMSQLVKDPTLNSFNSQEPFDQSKWVFLRCQCDHEQASQKHHHRLRGEGLPDCGRSTATQHCRLQAWPDRSMMRC